MAGLVVVVVCWSKEVEGIGDCFLSLPLLTMTSIHSQTRASGTGAQKRRLSIPSHKLSLDSVAGPTWRSLQTKTHNALVTLKSEYTEPGVVGKELALFAGYLVAGANDAAPGAVLPSIQEHYNIGYIVVSMIFICNLA